MDQLDAYRASRRRGANWLLRQINPDGSIGPIDVDFTYYRVPWTLALTGDSEAALRLCDWVRRHQFAADGDFVGVSPRQIEAYAYQNATFIYGAHMLRQFDLSYRGYQRLLAHRDPRSGGFCHRATGTGIARDENVPTVAMAGKTALMLGDLTTAEDAARWFGTLWEMQPALPDRLYYVINAETQALVTDFPPERAFHYVVEAQAPRQRFTCGGIAAAFLTRLYQATGNLAHLDLAREYMAFSMQSTERQFEVSQVCKTGWGAALLYTVTQEAVYADWARRVAEYFVADQLADGHWEDSGPYGRAHFFNILATAEFVMILDAMIGALALW